MVLSKLCDKCISQKKTEETKMILSGIWDQLEEIPSLLSCNEYKVKKIGILQKSNQKGDKDIKIILLDKIMLIGDFENGYSELKRILDLSIRRILK